MAKENYQGGKQFGQKRNWQMATLDDLNKEYMEDDSYSHVEELEEKLQKYKLQFVEYDLNGSGDIDFFELKLMLEKLGQAKTQMEAKKMLKEVAMENSETITYRDFLDMMLGKRNSVLRLILLFEEKMKEKDAATGPPPKRSVHDLP